MKEKSNSHADTRARERAKMNLQLQAKIDTAIFLLKKMEPIALKYREFGFICAFSGGKDSIVVRSLMKLAGVKHICKYQWTTIDPPEVYHFIQNKCPDVIIDKPLETFWQLCLKHGILPTQSKRFCCSELKEVRDFNCVVVTGVRAKESYRRAKRRELEIMTRRRHPDFVRGSLDQFNIYKESHIDCIKGKDKIIVNPIINWTEKDVWDYIQEFNLPVPELYEQGYNRVGCLFCPMASVKSLIKMEQDYPKYREAFIRLIHRLRQKRIDKGQLDKYLTLTDEEVFFAWIHKISYKKMIENKSQLKLDF